MFEKFIQSLECFWESCFGLKTGFDDWQNIEKFKDSVIDFSALGNWTILLLAVVSLFCLLFILDKKIGIIRHITKNLNKYAVVVWLLGILVYMVGFFHKDVTGLSVVLRSIISSFKMFVVSNDLARVSKQLQSDSLYMLWFSTVHFAAAFIAFMFIFKMIGFKIKSSGKILHKRLLTKKIEELHLFWGVNEHSLLLAESIRRSEKENKASKSTITFIDIDTDNDDNLQKKSSLSRITNTITVTGAEMSRLESIDTLVDHCYNGPANQNSNNGNIMEDLRLGGIWKLLKKSGKINFYLLSDDEKSNLIGALRLYKDTQINGLNIEKTIYVHARKDAKNEIFDHYSQYNGNNHKYRIKVVDSAFLAISDLKSDKMPLPVDCMEIEEGTGLVKSPFTALVVGFGDTGQEAFKYLYEYSAFLGKDGKRIPFKCLAIDGQMDRIDGNIKMKMPDIVDDGELELIKANVDSSIFWNSISETIHRLNYVVVALNDDDTGLSFSVNLMKYALKTRNAASCKLHIMLRCYNHSNERHMSEVVESFNRNIDTGKIEIYLFGKESDIYNCNTIILEQVFKDAKLYHWVYKGKQEATADAQWKKDFIKDDEKNLSAIDKTINRAKEEGKELSRYHAIYDINRKISQDFANTMHRRTKLALMGFDWKNIDKKRLEHFYSIVNTRDYKNNKTAYQCSEEDAVLLQNMAMVEHERWIASHRLMGFTLGPKTDIVKKLHEDMKSWKDLSEKIQSYDCNVVDTTIKLVYEEKNK